MTYCQKHVRTTSVCAECLLAKCRELGYHGSDLGVTEWIENQVRGTTSGFQVGSARCTKCHSLELGHSGREPYRLVCAKCGQHHMIVLQILPVDDHARLSPETGSSGTDTT